MRDTPLVSVIMPAYNSAAFLEAAIESVIEQEYHNWELFVIDDASTDHTVSIALDFRQKDPRIKLLQNASNEGTGAARNKGIKAAEGSFIAFLDADDLWLPGKLKTQVDFMLKNDLEMCFSSYLLMEEDGTLLPKFVEALPLLTYEKLLKSNYVGNLTGIYSVEKTGKVYAPLVRKRQDWALWLSILKRKGSTKSISEPLAVYRLRKNSISNNKIALLRYNFGIYSTFLNFGLLKSSRYMGRFLWEHFLVKNRQVRKLDQGSELL